MLVYLSVYVLAAVLLFQGVNLLVEPGAEDKVVPPEVSPAAAPASRWGGILVTAGAVLTAAGLLSHIWSVLEVALAPLRNLGLVVLAVYGLWLVFGPKVDYTPAPPSEEAHGHGHGH
jgi:hypothetical protein